MFRLCKGITHEQLQYWAAQLECILELRPSDSDVICERWLIVPVLWIIGLTPGIKTATIIDEVRNLIVPDEYADEILPSRTDARITQLVRNLRSHKTLERLGLATYTLGEWKITDSGKNLIEAIRLS